MNYENKSCKSNIFIISYNAIAYFEKKGKHCAIRRYFTVAGVFNIILKIEPLNEEPCSNIINVSNYAIYR